MTVKGLDTFVAGKTANTSHGNKIMNVRDENVSLTFESFLLKSGVLRIT